MSVLDVVAVVVIVGYVIGRQLLGEPLRGKRLMMLPAVIVAVGAIELFGDGHHPGAADIALIVVGAVVSAGIGVSQGSMMHLEARNGALWGRMPRRSLWLWFALVLSRLVLIGVASGLGAHMAASAAPILLTLGINRLSQAAVIAPRAIAAGIPFAPEKDGSSFLADLFGPSDGRSSQSYSVTPRPQGGGTTLGDRRRSGRHDR